MSAKRVPTSVRFGKHRPVVRAAIAHAQFETIHPFIDGNGRTGRALIHTVLHRADALRNILIPISMVFAGDTNAYIAGLTAFRADPPQLDDWVIAFAHATERAADNAVRLSADVAALDERMRAELIAYRRARGQDPAVPRRGAVIGRILDGLATDPVLTVESAAQKHRVSKTAAHKALVELADAGSSAARRTGAGGSTAGARRHLALVALTERSNRVGTGDTDRRRPKQGPPLPEIGQFGRLKPPQTTDTASRDGCDIRPVLPVSPDPDAGVTRREQQHVRSRLLLGAGAHLLSMRSTCVRATESTGQCRCGSTRPGHDPKIARQTGTQQENPLIKRRGRIAPTDDSTRASPNPARNGNPDHTVGPNRPHRRRNGALQPQPWAGRLDGKPLITRCR
ncbi:Fic family protein [Agromyces humatus]|uniref:Fido domain-containing protein n=1 Tax=Agromyces humatus TaxID=279573 RepID=A0ABN2K8J0_9MICO